ncbi:MAG: exonuclease SbcCD subunit D [Ilumatobacteraceae bacterium]
MSALCTVTTPLRKVHQWCHTPDACFGGMRILHTSDWHLGRSFGPVSLADHQHQFVDWLVGACADLRIDLVVVAGDIYDRSIPPIDAVVLFRDALRRLRANGHRVAVITGNHDGADRVAAYDDLIDVSGIYVRGGYGRLGEVISLPFDDGPLDLVLLPFLDPHAAPDDLPVGPHDAAPDEAHDDAFERRLRRTHESVLTAAIAATHPRLSSPRSVAVAHAFVSGCEVTDSERPLTVGGSGTVPASLFAGFSYTALGHLHRPQRVGGSDTVRYSGTPLAYSFSEGHGKSVTVVDMRPDGRCTVDIVPIDVGRAACTIEGTIDELLGAVPSAAVRDSFVRAVVTDPGVVLDAKQRLTAVYPHVVEIDLRPAVPAGDRAPAAVRRSLAPLDAVEAFWIESTSQPPTAAERDVLHQALAHAGGGRG